MLGNSQCLDLYTTLQTLYFLLRFLAVSHAHSSEYFLQAIL